MAKKRTPARRARNRQATPTRLTALTRSDGLVLRAGTADTSAATALKLARRIVRDELPGKWVVEPMGKGSRDFSVRRPAGASNPTPSQAFDFSYRLREHRDVEDCEPALVLPATGPEAMRSELVVRGRSSSSSSVGGEVPLSCASSHRWALDMCRIPAAWQLPKPAGGATQGRDIVVGHPDTGYTDHPEIVDPDRLLPKRGFDFEDEDSDPRDTLQGFSGGHGTGTGSVIMSSADGGVGIDGAAPQCKLVPLRTTTSVVLASFGKLAKAIRFAADRGHHVISISLGGPIYSRFLHRAVQDAVSNGVIIICAAGNVWPFVVYPARLDEVIAAAACNCQQRVWSGSASGPAVDITAPGESVWRAVADRNGFSVGQGSGTSFATAITAGTAALWLAHHGRDKLIARYGVANLAGVFKELLTTHGFDRPAGWDRQNFGAGILNAEKLLSAPLPLTAPARVLRGMRATGGPREKNQLDEILELFPDDKPEEVRASLSTLLRVDERELTVALREFGQEIAFHAATDMPFRESLRGRPRTRTARALVSRAGTPAARVSKRLQRMMTETG